MYLDQNAAGQARGHDGTTCTVNQRLVCATPEKNGGKKKKKKTTLKERVHKPQDAHVHTMSG